MKHDVKVPSPGESITEVYIGTWMKKTGDVVRKGEVLVDLETQKATVELEAEYSGRLEVLFPNTGDKLAVGEVIATIDDSVVSGNAMPASATPIKSSSAPSKALAAAAEADLSPAVRKIVAEREINPADVPATGKGGRLTKEDVLSYEKGRGAPAPINPPAPQGDRFNQPPMQSPAATTAPSVSSAVSPTHYAMDTARGDRRVPATRLRRQIAENLVRAQHTAAILTTFNEVDMSAILDFRKKNKDAFKEKHGVSLGMVGPFALAAARALKKYPVVGATFTGEDIIYHDYVDLSIAVSTERGLVVPVIRDLDKLDLVGFEKSLGALSEKARAGKLSIPEMTGGTFTISNGGVFGSLMSTPLLNMPQAAIIGLHKIQERPVVVDGQIVIRPMMYVALSYDHRIIDGRDAVLFLVAIKEAVENLDLIIDTKKML